MGLRTPSDGCGTYHVPTFKWSARSFLNEFVKSKGAAHHFNGIREVLQDEWAAEMLELPSSNPFYPFRNQFMAGLDGLPQLDHKATLDSLGLVEPSNPYGEAAMD